MASSIEVSTCIFLDQDGVINRDRVNYAYRLEDFVVLPRVPEALQRLKEAGYLLVIVTNQSGIAKGIYTREQMHDCHRYMNEATGHIIDMIYYAPYHPSVSESLTRKPDSLMLEKAIAKFNIDTANSWMIGDKERDLIPAQKLGIKGILVDETHPTSIAEVTVASLWEAAEWILDYGAKA